MFGATLKLGACVTDKLLAKFGPERLQQVEQLSTNVFRAILVGGEIALAIVLRDGSVLIREAEVLL